MIKNKKAILIALLFPIISLAGIAAYKKYILFLGHDFILPISGYDPRDLLSGYYLSYQINYGVDGICASNGITLKQEGYLCFEPRMFSYSAPKGCAKLIRGACLQGRFIAGIEKYYVSADMAKKLEQSLISKEASIVLSLASNGEAQVKDLLVNGKSWKE